MNNKILTLMIGMILLMSIIPIIAQDTDVNVCCEKTKSGAWCQNTVEDNCNSAFRKTPTSCSATSFCNPGCCFDSQEGLCMENTPEITCNAAEGTWVNDEECNIPQCELACCVLGTQASFVTLTRCKQLSSFYGLETNFRKDVGDEISCISLASSQDKGACVFDSEYETTCQFTTRAADDDDDDEEYLNKYKNKWKHNFWS